MPVEMIVLIVCGVLLLLVLIWFVATYNRLVSLQNHIKESWSNIDTELRRRYDLIPNLVETVKGYAAHEQAVFEAVSRARAQALASLGDQIRQRQDASELVRALRPLLAVVEAYPQLKADRQFLKLQQELINTEDRIQASRRFFNGNVRENNVLVQTFPSKLIASMFGFESKEFFEIEDLQARQPVNVAFDPRKDST
jgi:LemA protein